MAEEARYTVGELADAAGVTARTIRYYTTEGLLPPPDTRGRYALYSVDHLNRLLLIARLKDVYLPLGEIKARMERLSADQIEQLLSEDTEQRRPSSSAADYVAQVLATAALPPLAPRALAEAPASYAPHVAADTAAAPGGLGLALPAPAAAAARVAEAPPAAEGNSDLTPPAPSAAPARAGLLKRLVTRGHEVSAPAASAEETWQRLTLAPGVELHLREPLPPELRERVVQLIERARELLGGE